MYLTSLSAFVRQWKAGSRKPQHGCGSFITPSYLLSLLLATVQFHGRNGLSGDALGVGSAAGHLLSFGCEHFTEFRAVLYLEDLEFVQPGVDRGLHVFTERACTCEATDVSGNVVFDVGGQFFEENDI